MLVLATNLHRFTPATTLHNGDEVRNSSACVERKFRHDNGLGVEDGEGSPATD